MRISFLSIPVVAVACLAGCATNVSANGDQADAEATASSTATAIVVVERTVSGASESPRTEAIARFVKMRVGAVDDDAIRMVGGAVDFPAVGTCAALGPPANGARSSTPMRAMALVDVGVVTLEAGGVKTSLLPRQLPDVADLVSGVVYAARPSDSAIPARGRFVLRAAGSLELDVGAFAVEATAPGEPSDLRIAGQDARAPLGITLPAAAAAAGASADVTWEPGGVDDVVYIDVVPAAPALTNAPLGPSTPTVRCLFADSGRATVPALALAAFEEGTLNVHRLHREAFRARGVDPGEVRFDFARAVPFNRR